MLQDILASTKISNAFWLSYRIQYFQQFLYSVTIVCNKDLLHNFWEFSVFKTSSYCANPLQLLSNRQEISTSSKIITQKKFHMITCKFLWFVLHGKFSTWRDFPRTNLIFITTFIFIIIFFFGQLTYICLYSISCETIFFYGEKYSFYFCISWLV